MSKVLIVKSAAAAQSASFAPTVTGGGNAAMQMNLPAGKGVTGYGRIVPALGAALGALNTLADDSQGDLFSSMGQAGMRGYTGYQAASQALGPAQRYAQQFTPAGRVAAAKQGLQNNQLSANNTMLNPNTGQPMTPEEQKRTHLNASGNMVTIPQAPTLGMDSQSNWMDFMDSTAGSTSGNVHQNNYDAETGKNADSSMHHIGAMVNEADKIKPPDTNEKSVIDGQQAESANEKEFRLRQQHVKEAGDVMRDNALKSVRHWRYY